MKSTLLKLHIAVFLWCFTGVLGRLITLNEGLLVWWRLLITIVTLASIMIFRKEFTKISYSAVFRLFGIGFLVALHWICFYGSIKVANVSIALICLSSSGLLTALLEPLMLKRKPVIAELALGLLAVIGIYLVFHFDTRYRTGIIIGILSALLSVLFSIMNKKAVADIAPKTMMFYELTGGFLMLTCVMPIYLQYFPSKDLMPSLNDWGWLLILSWFCTVLAMNLSLQALKKISAFTQNLTLNLEPVYGIILAFAVYGEHKELKGSFYIGFMLILLAVVIQMLRVVKMKKQ